MPESVQTSAVESPSPFDVERTDSFTKKIPFGCGNLYLTIDTVSAYPVRLSLAVGKTGCCERALLEAVSRLVNLALRNTTPIEDLVLELVGIRCDKGMAGPGRSSCMDAVADAFREYLPELEQVGPANTAKNDPDDKDDHGRQDDNGSNV